jgi:hypothetical protein
MAFKYGKKAPARLSTTLALTDFQDMTWPPVKAQGWEYAPKPIVLDMLGNDTVGDCVIAAAMHFAQNETANTGAPLTPSRDLALQTYSAITGYDPAQTDDQGNNPTDNGTDFESQLFPYWTNHGIPLLDSSGNTVLHKILGFASLDLGSTAQQRYASFTFGGVLWGINCPSSAENDTSNWVVTPGATIVGGHGVNQMGQGAAGGHLNSWGLSIPFQWSFMRTYADEAYCVVTPQWLSAQGESPSGLDLNGLLAAMAQVKGAA